ncbi:hypothetical protein Ait01nite_083570 [Actinoplanes italicus]|nr:hypothetical protein Ait01nite_083570 [Actinoplanes italicus]
MRWNRLRLGRFGLVGRRRVARLRLGGLFRLTGLGIAGLRLVRGWRLVRLRVSGFRVVRCRLVESRLSWRQAGGLLSVTGHSVSNLSVSDRRRTTGPDRAAVHGRLSRGTG